MQADTGILCTALFVPLALVPVPERGRFFCRRTAIGSLSAAALMSFEYDPAGEGQGQASQSIAGFSRQMLRTNYGRFVAFNYLLYFGTFILALFVVPFMIKELSFSYLQLMVAISIANLVKFLTMPLWGRWAIATAAGRPSSCPLP